ncbi:hypothetical protein KXW98_002082 [Aspergillus fumigatus]|uniref:Cyclin n=1 Tax=Aspergillus fumigatus TaxID=746128 RepID=A0A229Y0V2_ASPFM|nr:hypothetical protein CNMCM8714_006441 [Aspergillus fumigatus]KAF4270354.1 hypothetical protein CNMCM8812_001156 [Aspergillus fumigatus]KAF4282545.1 hypothetical protein CNMCM8689_008193 [Aspergillus fumigatus]KAF4292078.1 hypothetical protein CNMCM8686_007893 [Aspergillus fumigatus]KAH1270094.1 hypothetical protein KXX45_002158 [Aspergillus fumigatus]
MDFYLRCNALKCRSLLKEQAVVTTYTLGLSHPTHGERRCPACQTILVNPDDAASTVLNPSEDYKTSVLSGLDPNTIMECASRALVFWAYQATQEMCVLPIFPIDFCINFLTGDRFYQEYLGKSLTEKYSTLNTHMDRVIHNANTEISALQAKLNSMQATEEQLRKKNQELVNLYREKCKKFAQITNLYNILKSRAMRSQMRTAASDTVSQTLDSLGNSVNARSVSGLSRPMGVSQPPQTPASHQGNPRPVNLEGVEQLHRHQRSGTGSSKSTKQKVDAAVMPPPTVPVNLRNRSIPNATPQQRTRLPGPVRPSTGMSSLPQDSAMFERFHDINIPDHYLNSGNTSLNRDSQDFQRHDPGTANGPGNGSSVPRSSVFQNTII